MDGQLSTCFMPTCSQHEANMAFLPTGLLLWLHWNIRITIRAQRKAHLSILSPAVAIASA